MSQLTTIFNTLILIVVVVVAFFYLRKQLFNNDYGHRMIKIMFFTIVFVLTFDLLTDITELFVSLSILYRILTAINSAIIPSLGFFWLLYIHNLVNLGINRKLVWLVACIILLGNLVLSILSVIPGMTIYYTFTLVSTPALLHTNVSQYYYIYAIITLLPYILATIILINNWQKLVKKRRPFVYLGVSAFPVFGILCQALDLDNSITITSIVITFVIIVLDLQHYFVVTDYLTGLYNRRRLSQKLKEKIRKMHSTKLFGGYMIDVNYFKTINDELGHAYGDKILRDVSDILLGLVGNSDLVARYGGDEFIIIKDLNAQGELRVFKHQIIDAIEAYNKANNYKHVVQLSIGAHIYTKNDDYTAERFLEIIDDQMYRNKKMLKQLDHN